MKVTIQSPFKASVYSGDSVQLDNDQLVLFRRGQECRRVVLTPQTRATIENETAAHIPAVWPSALHLLPWLALAGISLFINIDYAAMMAVPWMKWAVFHVALGVSTLACMWAVRKVAICLDGPNALGETSTERRG